MSPRPQETTTQHTRLLKCALEVEDARAYWARVDGPHQGTAERAFTEYWFGSRSLPRVRVLLANFRARFDAIPPALRVLSAWRAAGPHRMDPDTRRLVCHWHLQLADPVYRAFTGDYLVAQRQRDRPETTRDRVITWVSDLGPARWTLATRIQFASKLLSSAYAAGLVATTRDPRRLVLPPVSDHALAYAMYLLRGVDFAGTLLANPYLTSIGLTGHDLERRLAALPGLRARRQGDIFDFGWAYDDLEAWARGELLQEAA